MKTHEMKIDWSKPVQYRNGKKATVLTTERPIGLYIKGPVLSMREDGFVVSHDANGKAAKDSSNYDLIQHREDGSPIWCDPVPEGYEIVTEPPATLWFSKARGQWESRMRADFSALSYGVTYARKITPTKTPRQIAEESLPAEINGYATRFVGCGEECEGVVGKRVAQFDRGFWVSYNIILEGLHEQSPDLFIAELIPNVAPYYTLETWPVEATRIRYSDSEIHYPVGTANTVSIRVERDRDYSWLADNAELYIPGKGWQPARPQS